MLLPPHISLCFAIEPLRIDLIKMQQGVLFNQYSGDKVEKILVKGLISCLIADHPQACDISRHLGVNANQNCRACWVSKEERTKFTSKILDHAQTRRRHQTDVIVDNMRRKLSQRFSVMKQKALQKESGIRVMDCPLKGVDFDPHIQCFPDIDHFLDLGLMKVLFEYINSLMTEKQVEIIQKRYEYLQLPVRWHRIALHLKSGSKKTKPMTYMRKIGLLGTVLYRGLIDDHLQNLLLKLLHLRGMILAPFHTDSSVKKVHIRFFFFFFKYLSVIHLLPIITPLLQTPFPNERKQNNSALIF